MYKSQFKFLNPFGLIFALLLLVISARASEPSLSILPTTLPGEVVSFWSFHESQWETASSTMHDQSGGSAQVYGDVSPVTVEGSNSLNRAAVFDGVDDYIELDDSITFSNLTEITVSAWIKTDTPQTSLIFGKSDGGIISGSPNTSPVEFYLATLTDGLTSHGLKFTVLSESGQYAECSAAFGYTDNEWHYVAGSYDGHVVSLVIDGLRFKYCFLQGRIKSLPEQKIRIGSQKQSAFFKGQIDEVFVSNKARTPEQLKRIYLEQKYPAFYQRPVYTYPATSCGNSVCELGESRAFCSLDCANFIPENENVLCVYNSLSALSTEICDYYTQKRPGASKLGLELADSLFADTLKEEMTYYNFKKYVAEPVHAYANSKQGAKITHLAVAKDLPAVVVWLKGWRVPDPANTVGTAATSFLASPELYLGSWPENAVNGTYTLPASMNSYFLDGVHFEPENFYNPETKIYENRFVVSHLTGYNLADIKKAIDKAVEPAGDPLNYLWLVDLYDIAFQETIGNSDTMYGGELMAEGVAPANIIYPQERYPISLFDPVTMYVGWGNYAPRYGQLWLTNGGLFDFSMADHAVMSSMESWNGYTFSGDASHVSTTRPDQGKLADALTPNAFGGQDYSRSFAGAFGWVAEPGLWGAMTHASRFFRQYAAGLTLAESYWTTVGSQRTHLIVIGDPLLRLTDSAATGLPAGAVCRADADCRQGNCDADTAGVKRCHATVDSCVRSPGIYGAEARPGYGLCDPQNDSLMLVCNDSAWQQTNTPGSDFKCSRGEWKKRNGVACSLAAECASNVCSEDLAGAKRCHQTAGSCVVDSFASEIPNGGCLCLESNLRRACQNGVWDSAQICGGSCLVNVCEGVDFIEPAQFKLKANNVYSYTLPVNLVSPKIADLFSTPPADTQLWVWRAEKQDYSNYIFMPGYGWLGESAEATEDIISLGQGFLISAPQDYDLTVAGAALEAPVAVRIKDQYSLVGLPYCGKNYTASQAFAEIKALEPRCQALMTGLPSPAPVYWWSDDSSYTQEGGTKNNFQLTNFSAYFVKCVAGVDFTWTPSCQPLPPATYTVGGTISGLSRGNLLLQNNHEYDYATSSDGVFAFEIALPSGSPYDVTIASQPAGLSCSITNDSGIITDSNIINIAVNCLDSAGPTISALATSTTQTTARINWQTDEPASSLIEYGLTADYGSQASSSALVISHEFNLTGLAANTRYFFRITLTDAFSNRTVMTDQNFNTLPPNLTVVPPPSGGGGGGGTPASTDTSAPANVSVIINSGAATTTSRIVTLTLSANDSSSIQMAISNNSDFSGASWENYSTSKLWLLTGDNGTKTVYAKFKDTSNNVSSIVSDSIVLNIAEAATLPTPMPSVLGVKIINTFNDYIKAQKNLLTKIDKTLTKRLAGKILLQVQDRGEAWYIDMVSQNRFYLADGARAYGALRKFGLGITNKDLAKIPVGVEKRFLDSDTDADGLADKLEEGLATDKNKEDTDGDGVSDYDEAIKSQTNPLGAGKLIYDNKLVGRLKGRIVLQIENRGEAWYINPADGKRYYMKDGEAAYQIMRFLSLGITNENIRKINIGD